MSSSAELNPAQRARIEEFKKEHGRKWKVQLYELWWRGSDILEKNGYLLREVRNLFGLNWLSNQVADGADPIRKIS